MKINQTEMLKLYQGLTERGIEHQLHSLWGGYQIRCATWDAICHQYSYGGEQGLLEVMGLPQCEGDVIGNLTAEEVLKMVDEAAI